MFGSAARGRVIGARNCLSRALAGGKPIYGVNTGFGELAGTRIDAHDLKTLQRNLVLSHASGVGEPLTQEEARGILFLRANELARGNSGVRPIVVELMASMLNAGLVPVIPSRGSVGASGDLAPLAHMALLLIGEGSVFYRGRKIGGREGLRRAGLSPIELEFKEGLSLLNGTQAMQSVGGQAIYRAGLALDSAQLAGAMSLEALTGTPVPFEELIHRLKPHGGQRRAAAEMRSLLAGSAIRESHRENDSRVQDPYSLRCIPQVHGAAYDALEFARRTLEIELASVTDNPLVAGGRILSGGNFHGQAISQAFDFTAIAMTAMGNISERRIFQLVSGQGPGLTPFLAERPGLESGWMLAQVAAAALASENKGLAHPASADSIPTSANKEDFVSMGMGAALKLSRVVFNFSQIAAFELLCAALGVEAHSPLAPGRGVARGLKLLRAKVPASRGDSVIGPKAELVRELILNGYFEEGP